MFKYLESIIYILIIYIKVIIGICIIEEITKVIKKKIKKQEVRYCIVR